MPARQRVASAAVGLLTLVLFAPDARAGQEVTWTPGSCRDSIGQVVAINGNSSATFSSCATVISEALDYFIAARTKAEADCAGVGGTVRWSAPYYYPSIGNCSSSTLNTYHGITTSGQCRCAPCPPKRSSARSDTLGEVCLSEEIDTSADACEYSPEEIGLFEMAPENGPWETIVADDPMLAQLEADLALGCEGTSAPGPGPDELPLCLGDTGGAGGSSGAGGMGGAGGSSGAGGASGMSGASGASGAGSAGGTGGAGGPTAGSGGAGGEPAEISDNELPDSSHDHPQKSPSFT